MPVYSHSQLTVYEECPLKYKLQYLDKVKPEEEVEGIEGFMGSRVHQALQKVYDDLKFTRLNSLADLLSFYDQAWEKNWHDDIVITKADLTAENYRTLGTKLIENYYNHYAPFDRELTIGTEMPFNFSLDSEGKYKIRGFIDRLARAKDGAFEIHDYKTSSHLPSQDELDNDRQLSLYHLGVQQKWPQAKGIRLIWHFLAFDEEMISTHTEETLAQLRQETTRLIDEIEVATDFLPRCTFLCQWCEFPAYCPLKKHPHKVENLPVNEYLKEPGVMLVNKYAELKEQANLIGTELDKVREAIIEYARRNQMTVLKGNDRLARVRFSMKWKFPTKKEEFRGELDGIIIKAGKWMEVSQLNSNALARVVENRSWSRELIDRVMKYGRLEESATIFLKHLKDEIFHD